MLANTLDEVCSTTGVSERAVSSIPVKRYADSTVDNYCSARLVEGQDTGKKVPVGFIGEARLQEAGQLNEAQQLVRREGLLGGLPIAVEAARPTHPYQNPARPL